MNKMINIFLHISLLLLPFLVYAQQGVVGINNSNPKATLDISATPNSNIAIDVKKYVKAIFGATSPQYKQISGIKFTKPKK